MDYVLNFSLNVSPNVLGAEKLTIMSTSCNYSQQEEKTQTRQSLVERIVTFLTALSHDHYEMDRLPDHILSYSLRNCPDLLHLPSVLVGMQVSKKNIKKPFEHIKWWVGKPKKMKL